MLTNSGKPGLINIEARTEEKHTRTLVQGARLAYYTRLNPVQVCWASGEILEDDFKISLFIQIMSLCWNIIYIYFQSDIEARKEISCIERPLTVQQQILSRIRRICTTAPIYPRRGLL